MRRTGVSVALSFQMLLSFERWSSCRHGEIESGLEENDDYFEYANRGDAAKNTPPHCGWCLRHRRRGTMQFLI